MALQIQDPKLPLSCCRDRILISIRKCPAFLLVCLSFFCPLLLLAGPNDFIDRLSYADKLYNAQDYFRAYSEYSFLSHFFPERAQSSNITLRMARTLLFAEQHSQLKRLLLENPKWDTDLATIQGISAFQTEDWTGAKNAFTSALTGPKSQNTKVIPQLLLASTLAQTGDFGPARTNLSEVISVADAATVEIAVRLDKVIRTREKTRHTSPNVAALLSIIPGLGSFYAGKPVEGCITFVAGAASIYTGYSWIEKKDYLEAGLWGMAFLYFYARNFTAAYEAATDRNEKRERMIPEFIKNDLPLMNKIRLELSFSQPELRYSFSF